MEGVNELKNSNLKIVKFNCNEINRLNQQPFVSVEQTAAFEHK